MQAFTLCVLCQAWSNIAAFDRNFCALLPLPSCAAVQVTYDFNRARMLVEPLLLAGFFLACFLAAMVAGRVDMRIRRGVGAAATKG